MTRHILPNSETPNSESNRRAAVEKREAQGEVVTKPLCQPSELKKQRGQSPIFSSAGAARGKLVKGQSVLVNGTTFGENAADVAVRFAYGDGAEATATVTGCGENLISVAWPDELSALPDGTEVSIVVIRTSGSATYVSTPRSAIVVG